jgi:hypothetical protein
MELLLLLFWIACGIGAAFVGSSRGASGCLWAVLGFTLGPIGLLMSFAAISEHKCPHCQSGIAKEATRCPKCQADLVPPKFRCPKCKTGLPTNTPACPSCQAPINWSGTAASQSDPRNPAPLLKKCPDCAEDVRAEHDI